MLNFPKAGVAPKHRRLSSIAVLTRGGDAPGMNAAVRAVVRYGISQGIVIIKYNYLNPAHQRLFICKVLFVYRNINYQIR